MAASTATGSSNVSGVLQGKLIGKKPTDLLDFDPYSPNVVISELFGELNGAALLDAIVDYYGVGTRDIPWHSSDGTRNLIRSPLSREIQEGTVQEYVQRILKDGLSQKVSGAARQ